MGTVDSEPDDEEAQAQYWADVHHLAELSEVIARSYEALVLLLAEGYQCRCRGIWGWEVWMRREWKMRKRDMYK